MEATDGKLKGAAMVLLASFFWGTISPAGRLLAHEGTDVLSVVVLRALIAALAVGLALALSRPSSLLPRSLGDLLIASAGGLFGVCFNYAGFLMALKHMEVPYVLAIFYTFPFITALLGRLSLGEPVDRNKLLGFLVFSAGLSMVVRPWSSTGGINPRGALFALMGATGMASYSVFGRLWSLKHSGRDQTTFFFLCMASGALWLSLTSKLARGEVLVQPISPRALLLALYLGVVATVGGYGLFVRGLRHLEASTASILATGEIAFAMGLNALLVGEVPSVAEVLGASLVALSIAVSCANGIPGSRAKPEKGKSQD